MFGTKIGIIEQATTDNDNPTPGYIYNQICQLSKKDANTCERILRYLLNKLKKQNSPAVKLKVLLVIKQLLQKGNSHFQICLQRQSEELRPFLNFRGPPDPIHGEAPYRLVRENTQLVLNLSFETRNPEQEQRMDSVSSNTFGSLGSSSGGRPGFSNNSVSNTSFSPSQSNRNMNSRSNTGFSSGRSNNNGFSSSSNNNGFSSSNDNRSIQNNVGVRRTPKKGILESFIESAQNGFGLEEGTKRLQTGSSGRFNFQTNESSFGNPYGGRANSTYSSVSSNTYNRTSPQSSYGNPSLQNRHVMSNSANLSQFDEPRTDAPTFWETEPNQQSSEDDEILHTQEASIIEKYTKPSGVRLVPSRSQVAQFLDQCQSMNILTVCIILAYRLGTSDWKAQLKVAHLILSLIEEKNDEVIGFFLSEEQIDNIADVMSKSTRNSVTEKLGSILTALHPYKDLFNYESEPHDEQEYDDQEHDEQDNDVNEDVENQSLFDQEQGDDSLFGEMNLEGEEGSLYENTQEEYDYDSQTVNGDSVFDNLETDSFASLENNTEEGSLFEDLQTE
eukprot:TRINITY_DN5493_c0_g1_i2.p1 TRINITY_DN5493_c0_g1~~TRINITY_DN5493_c0_g1_i2.p1  ORF type:complete len:569 (-),score=136.09 TRINITY_DN5493_c0_g1_i2:7-1683(-)